MTAHIRSAPAIFASPADFSVQIELRFENKSQDQKVTAGHLYYDRSIHVDDACVDADAEELTYIFIIMTMHDPGNTQFFHYITSLPTMFLNLCLIPAHFDLRNMSCRAASAQLNELLAPLRIQRSMGIISAVEYAEPSSHTMREQGVRYAFCRPLPLGLSVSLSLSICLFFSDSFSVCLSVSFPDCLSSPRSLFLLVSLSSFPLASSLLVCPSFSVHTCLFLSFSLSVHALSDNKELRQHLKEQHVQCCNRVDLSILQKVNGYMHKI